MKIKQLLTKTLLVAVALLGGASFVWGAGYTRTLTGSLEIDGYAVNTLYDFQNNTPDVLPTTGDLRYRDGGVWGLHNYESGARSATVTIPVNSGDLLVLQDYSASYPTTVNVGTLNETLSTNSGYRCFEITSDAASITLTCPRYGGVVAALVMNVAYAYTVNAKYSSTTLKTIKTGYGLPNAQTYYHYHQVLNYNGSLYQADAISSGYKSSFTLDEDGKVVEHTYKLPSTPINNLVFLAEGEDIFTKGTGSSADTRCSMGAGGYASSKTPFVTLPAGTYYMVLSNRCSGNRTGIHKFYKGNDADPFYSADGNGYNATRESGEFTLNATTTLYMQGGDNNQYVDWIYIYGTPDNEIVGAIDFSSAANSVRSSNYTMKKGDTKVFTFQNHGTTYGNNWRIEVKEGETWKSNTCADSYDYTAGAATNVTSYKMSTDGGSSKVDLDWNKYAEDMADANCVATLTYKDNGTLEIRTTSTGTKNSYIYYVDNDVTGLTGDLTINLSVCNSWLEVLSVEQTTAGVSVGTAGMATYVNSDYDLDFSASEIKAYKVKVAPKGVATMTPVNNVPKDTPVLLVKDGGATEAIPVMTGAAAVTENDLVKGTGAAVPTYETVNMDNDYTNMVLNNKNSKLGFYFANSLTVAANRAYLHFESTLAPDTNAPMMLVFDGETTGISTMHNSQCIMHNEIYDLQGRKVVKPAKGLYIVNGKKVVIK